MNETLICAHSAGSALDPENSVEAARKSLGILGPKAQIEFDIQRTRDNEFALTHGNTLDSIRFALGLQGSIAK